MTPLLVAVGAALGATLRFHVAHYLDGRFPRGTLLVNATGSFVLGLLFGAAVSTDGLALLGTGFCGGLTTYSAFAVQTRDQGRAHGPGPGAAYAVLTVGLALGTCALGFWAAQA